MRVDPNAIPAWQYRCATEADWKLIDQVLEAAARGWPALKAAVERLDSNDVTPMVERALDHVCTLPDSIQEALNSGDGTYRP